MEPVEAAQHIFVPLLGNDLPPERCKGVGLDMDGARRLAPGRQKRFHPGGGHPPDAEPQRRPGEHEGQSRHGQGLSRRRAPKAEHGQDEKRQGKNRINDKNRGNRNSGIGKWQKNPRTVGGDHIQEQMGEHARIQKHKKSARADISAEAGHDPGQQPGHDRAAKQGMGIAPVVAHVGFRSQQRDNIINIRQPSGKGGQRHKPLPRRKTIPSGLPNEHAGRDVGDGIHGRSRKKIAFFG